MIDTALQESAGNNKSSAYKNAWAQNFIQFQDPWNTSVDPGTPRLGTTWASGECFMLYRV